MNMLKMQINTNPAYSRDMTVELTNQVTGEKKTVKPYSDGSIAVSNIADGRWRVKVTHPNIVFPLLDKDIQVFKDRPTFTPLVIPENIFENTPIADIPDADLAPPQKKLDEVAESANRQAHKLAGQPIYADDWNELATALADTAAATRELSTLVSPRCHDHPEIVAKFEEVQRNIQKMYDAFGASLAQLQRQIQQLALQRKVDAALDKIPSVTPEVRQGMNTAVATIADSWAESPAIFSSVKKRAAQNIQEKMSALLATADPAVRNNDDVKDLDTFTQAMSSETTARTYEEEISQSQRTSSKSRTGIVFDAMQTRR
jgi:hypothetical protein